MLVQAIAVSFIIAPVPLVDVAIGVPKLALAVRPVIAPLAFVAAPVRPLLLAPARAHAVHVCVAMIDGTGVWRLEVLCHFQILADDKLLEPRHLLFGLRLVALQVALMVRRSLFLVAVLLLRLSLAVDSAIMGNLLRLGGCEVSATASLSHVCFGLQMWKE